MRYELTDHEWAAIQPFLPNKPRGVPRVNDRRVLNGIFWVLRSGAPWRDFDEVTDLAVSKSPCADLNRRNSLEQSSCPRLFETQFAYLRR
jgi:hypothetical protein